MQADNAHDVDLHAEQGGHGRDVEKREQPQDEGEYRVRGAGTLDHMPDVDNPEGLQQLPDHRRNYRARYDVAYRQVPSRSKAEPEDGHGDVDHNRRRHRQGPSKSPEYP